jgi:hypothetical protein
MCRFLPSVPGYVYAQGVNNLYVNLFVSSSAKINLNPDLKISITQATQYPWDGEVKMVVSPEKSGRFALSLRIPGWAKNQPIPGDLYTYTTPEKDAVTIKVNGTVIAFKAKNGYAVINRKWEKGDVVNYSLPMTIHRVKANAKVAEDFGKVAIERGPIVFCLEGVDNLKIDQVFLAPGNKLTAVFNPGLLNGIETISAHDGSDQELFTAIPYYTWNNRGAGKMKVWIPQKP